MFIDDRLFHWLMGNDTGISSRTIASAITGMQLSENYDIPYDPSDFGRCYRLLTTIPEWRKLLHKVALAFPYWQPFVDHWQEMERLYEEELPSGNAPKLYKVMQRLVEEANEIKQNRAVFLTRTQLEHPLPIEEKLDMEVLSQEEVKKLFQK